MPPSPRLKVSIVPEKYHALCESMGLRAVPPVSFSARGGRIYGVYMPHSNTITIYHGQEFFETNRLRAVNAELVHTLLHELRHAWQDQEWPAGHYEKNVVRAENDANDFADTHVHEWRGVIRVGRKTYSRLPA